jgi:hypothetical protein
LKEEREEWKGAARRLQELCWDLRLASAIARFDRMVLELGAKEPVVESLTRRPQVKGRSMSI